MRCELVCAGRQAMQAVEELSSDGKPIMKAVKEMPEGRRGSTLVYPPYAKKIILVRFFSDFFKFLVCKGWFSCGLNSTILV